MAGDIKEMRELFNALVKELTKRVQKGECSATDLSVARQFLKDNGIEAIPDKHPGMEKLKEEVENLTFDDDEIDDPALMQ